MSSTTLQLEDSDSIKCPVDPRIVIGVLEKIAAEEAGFTERFYEIFFRLRPDALPLFGVHSIAEREEMMGETLRSLYALTKGDNWLEGNLVALGQSHHEYGVTEDMYDSYCDSMIDCAREILGDRFSDLEAAALRLAISEITRRMVRAAAMTDPERAPTADPPFIPSD